MQGFWSCCWSLPPFILCLPTRGMKTTVTPRNVARENENTTTSSANRNTTREQGITTMSSVNTNITRERGSTTENNARNVSTTEETRDSIDTGCLDSLDASSMLALARPLPPSFLEPFQRSKPSAFEYMRKNVFSS